MKMLFNRATRKSKVSTGPSVTDGAIVKSRDCSCPSVMANVEATFFPEV
jgi:hypothetical protein